MKILIVSYHTPLDVTPRGFRVRSLKEGLANIGYDPVIICPPKAIKKQHIRPKKPSRIKTIIRKGIEKLLPGGKELRYLPFYFKALKKQDVDLVISIGLPFMVHLAVALTKKCGLLSSKNTFFDYGDPYSGNPAAGACFYASKLEAWTLTECDAILIPVQHAAAMFDPIIDDKEKIKIVPQGVNLNSYRTDKYVKNRITTFCYAGIFYSEIRDPTPFLEYLTGLDFDFLFIIYTDLGNADTASILGKYTEKLQGKLVIHDMIKRDDCIFELSKVDFLISFSNLGGVQQPSKLIDYSLANRPFLTINNDQVNFEQFMSYCNEDYSSQAYFCLDNFDQNLIAKKIISLVKP